MVGPRLFARRIGRNEGFNHAGNAVSAALAAGLATLFGPVVVFWIMGALAVLSIGAMLMVPADAIDDDVARGLDCPPGEESCEQPSGVAALLQNRLLLLFAVLAALFHLANAAMLTSVGQLLTHLSGKDHATSLIAICIVAAQCVMVPVAMFVGAKADTIGRKPIFLAAFGVLALRGVLYTLSDNPFWLVGVQLLDGVGAGVYGALFPIVVADLTRGTGRFNVSQGAVATPGPRRGAERDARRRHHRVGRLLGGLPDVGGDRGRRFSRSTCSRCPRPARGLRAPVIRRCRAPPLRCRRRENSQRRPALVPVGRLLVGLPDAERRRLVVAAAADLERQRQAAGGEAVRQRQRAHLQQVDEAGEARRHDVLVEAGEGGGRPSRWSG